MRQSRVIAAWRRPAGQWASRGAESPEQHRAVRRRCPAALIIGLWKRSFADSSVYHHAGEWEDHQGRLGRRPPMWSASMPLPDPRSDPGRRGAARTDRSGPHELAPR